jgi:hypothetical protein
MVSVWPVLALVGSYELLIVVIREDHEQVNARCLPIPLRTTPSRAQRWMYHLCRLMRQRWHRRYGSGTVPAEASEP